MVIALADDATQPIKVKAQTVLIDEKQGLSVYTGKASVVQGSLILSAEKIQLFSNQTEVTKVIAKGDKKQRAHYQQSQPSQSRFIEATADNITYLIQKELVHLRGHAHLVQGFDSFSGGTLDYDIKNDKVIANKSKDGAQRVRFKIKL
jgi:lipopolysaccharide export system protein LptA